jgi:hypothetical protein
MPYKFSVRAPDRGTYGSGARIDMPWNEVLDHFYGAGGYEEVPSDIRAMRRDQWPSEEAGHHPHSMLAPRFKELDFLSVPGTVAGRSKMLGDLKRSVVSRVDEWAAAGLPVKRDEWREHDMPDTGALAEIIVSGSDRRLANKFFDDYAYHAQLIAYIDNLSKFTLQRYVPPLWYMQNMSANRVAITPLMKRALGLLQRIATRLLRSNEGKILLAEVRDTYSDPIGTAVGWPLFTSSTTLTDEVTDDAKFQVLALFEDVGKGHNWADSAESFESFITALSHRVPAGYLRDFPLAYLVNRRSRVGGKYYPDWALKRGAVLQYEIAGAPYSRIAQAAPWVGNLLQGQVLPYFKALRMLLTGCYHTGEMTNLHLEHLRSGSQFVVESDISQYDLNFALDITDAIDDIIASLSPKPRYAKAMLASIRRRGILMPHPENMGQQTTGLMTKGPIMLPSGIKLTAEYGTLGNVLVTLCYQLAKGERESTIIDYWDARTHNHKPRWLMQGDDKAVIGPDPYALTAQVKEEATLYGMIGTSAKVELSDRFLQKHLMDGRRLPVVGRIVQQRLGNENSPDTPEQVVVGLTASTLGVLNYLGPDQVAAERAKGKLGRRILDLQQEGMDLILSSYTTAGAPYKDLIDSTKAVLQSRRDGGLAAHAAGKRAAAKLIAKLQAIDGELDISSASKLLLFMDRNRYSASVASFFDTLEEQSDEWASLILEYENKKIEFARAAYEILGIPQDLLVPLKDYPRVSQTQQQETKDSDADSD